MVREKHPDSAQFFRHFMHLLARFERSGRIAPLWGQLRMGDLGYIDEEGYFFFVDRLKRMINASGYKVRHAEVETLLFEHPAIQEACFVAARDARRGRQ